MATDVDICNLALGHLGNSTSVRNISPPDNSEEARRCAAYYPQARDVALAWTDWTFAKRIDDLTPLENPVKAWTFRYKAPNLWLNPIAVYVTGFDVPQAFEMGSHDTDGIVVHTNADDAQMEYIKKITDVNKFSPLFFDALTYLLGSYLAGPLTNKAQKVKDLRLEFERRAGPPVTAAMRDANSGQNYQPTQTKLNYIPSSIKARRG